jgi:ankyrin repeat domain-containing protein 13
MDDFYVEITWNFESWIPIVSRFLPSDICKLYKHGAKLRLECTLGDIAVRNTTASNESGVAAANSSTTPFNWQRGDFTFIFDIESLGDKTNSVVFMDNKRKTFVNIDKNALQDEMEKIKELEDYEKEVDMLLSREMLFLKLQTKSAAFLPTQTGWFIKREKIEQVNGYTCQFYDVNGLYIVSKLRSEHLSEEEMKKRAEQQKKVQEQLTRSKSSSLDRNNKESNSSYNKINSVDNLTDMEKIDENSSIGDFEDAIEYRPSLPSPPKTNITWNEYINSEEGKHPVLGRPIRCKESRKEFKAQLAMVTFYY